MATFAGRRRERPVRRYPVRFKEDFRDDPARRARPFTARFDELGKAIAGGDFVLGIRPYD
jgi:hypothetical protein